MALLIKDTIKGTEWSVNIDDEQKFIDMMDAKIDAYIDILVNEEKIPVNASYSFYFDAGEGDVSPVKNLNSIISGHNGVHLISLVFQTKLTKRETVESAQ